MTGFLGFFCVPKFALSGTTVIQPRVRFSLVHRCCLISQSAAAEALVTALPLPYAHALPPNRPNTTKSHGDIDRCKSCKSDIGQIVTTVIVSAITTLGTLRYAHRRASPETDRNFFKAMGIIVGLIAFSTALGPMLAFRKHCTRSHTSALNMQDGWGPGQKSNAIDATSDRIHSTQARLHLHGLRGPPQGDVRRGAPRAPRTGEPRRGVRRAAARVDQYGLTFLDRTTTQGGLSYRRRPSGL